MTFNVTAINAHGKPITQSFEPTYNFGINGVTLSHDEMLSTVRGWGWGRNDGGLIRIFMTTEFEVESGDGTDWAYNGNFGHTVEEFQSFGQMERFFNKAN
jgi:hypothetical protein